jgi:hypothetical protein
MSYLMVFGQMLDNIVGLVQERSVIENKHRAALIRLSEQINQHLAWSGKIEVMNFYFSAKSGVIR